MGVDCTAGIAYGYYITREDEEILREKFGRDIWEILSWDYEDNSYPFELITLNAYRSDICDNILGVFINGSDYCDSFNPAEINLPAEQEFEIWRAIEELLGHSVDCKYYLFTKWW